MEKVHQCTSGLDTYVMSREDAWCGADCPSKQMFTCQILGTIVGCIVNQIALINVIEAKRPFLDGSAIDPTGQVSRRHCTRHDHC